MTHPDEQTLGRFRKDGDWDRRYRMPPRQARLEWRRDTSRIGHIAAPHCENCGLTNREHINGAFCPEWRLRQLDGDR